MSSPRLRFAPSPTGYLHIGGVRTALFNWLWAKKTGGTFVLRIEDTDRERSTAESEQVIFDSLNWLGIDWNEGPGVGGANGPYRQMERLETYVKWADDLVERGKAYRCYCTKEELDAQRAALTARDPKAQFRYPGTCRNRTDAPDLPFVVRFKTDTSGSVTYHDKVFGEIVTPNKELQDFVLLRTDKIPLYNFGAVVDDVSMGMTLIARGRDHMINTPPQILLYQALGANVPEFAHLPMMLNQKGAKLSKRDGAVGVFEYRDAGYTPMGVLNYLARFGWGHGDQEVFSRDQLIEAFSWEGCGRPDGKFDPKKFLAINHEHLKTQSLTSDAEYAEGLLPFLVTRGLIGLDVKHVQDLVWLVRDRGQTYVESAEKLDPFLREHMVMDPAAVEKALVPGVKIWLAALAEKLKGAEYTQAALETLLHDFMAEQNLSAKEIGPAVRVALTGKAASPGFLHQVMVALGRERTLSRLQAALGMIA